MVTPRPKAMLSPALPVVWVMLFSRMVARRTWNTLLNARKMVMESTATGMLALSVRPTLSRRPRKVRIKAQRDAVKLSTAYRADQLLADLVKTVLRGSPIDVEKVQIAARNFVRAVRERRQDGATLTIESNGRGKIDVRE